MKPSVAVVVVSSVLAVAVVAIAEDAKSPCRGCKPPACGGMECVFSCRPVVKKVPIEKERFNVKCEYICVPPVRLPGLCCLLGSGCDHGSDPAACGDCPGEAGGGRGRFPWQTGGRCTKCDHIRKVHKLSKEEFEDGEKCVVEWKLDCVCRPIGAGHAGVDSTSCGPQGCVQLGE